MEVRSWLWSLVTSWMTSLISLVGLSTAPCYYLILCGGEELAVEPGDQLDDLPVLPGGALGSTLLLILPCVEVSSWLWSLVTSWMTSLSSLVGLLVAPCY